MSEYRITKTFKTRPVSVDRSGPGTPYIREHLKPTDIDEQDTRPEPDSRDFEYEVLVEFYEKALVSIEELEREVGRLQDERDLAIAHDRQPYPTAWAYEQLALAHETLRTQNDALRDALIWCSGSKDFGPGGIAEKGFVSKVRPLLADSKIANVARYKAFKRFMKEEWSE